VVDNSVAIPRKSKPKGGRPSRVEASRRALSGVDLGTCDPLAILREIALDQSQPGSTRVSACRELLACRADAGAAGSQPSVDALTSRALQILQRRPN
jgi:hypothetical protein